MSVEVNLFVCWLARRQSLGAPPWERVPELEMLELVNALSLQWPDGLQLKPPVGESFDAPLNERFQQERLTLKRTKPDAPEATLLIVCNWDTYVLDLSLWTEQEHVEGWISALESGLRKINQKKSVLLGAVAATGTVPVMSRMDRITLIATGHPLQDAEAGNLRDVAASLTKLATARAEWYSDEHPRLGTTRKKLRESAAALLDEAKNGGLESHAHSLNDLEHELKRAAQMALMVRVNRENVDVIAASLPTNTGDSLRRCALEAKRLETQISSDVEYERLEFQALAATKDLRMLEAELSFARWTAIATYGFAFFSAAGLVQTFDDEIKAFSSTDNNAVTKLLALILAWVIAWVAIWFMSRIRWQRRRVSPTR